MEYAILLILLVTLFVGGTELGITALASNKNTEAAKTGISEYAVVNQQRLNILNAEKQYLITLAGYGCSVIYKITNDYEEGEPDVENDDGYTKVVAAVPPATEPTVELVKVDGQNVTRTTLIADDNDYSCNRLTDDQIKAGITKENTIYSSLIKLLDDIYKGTAVDIDDNPYTIDDLLSSLADLANALSTTTGNSPSEVLKSDSVDKNQDGVLTEEELLNGETFILDSSLQNVADDDKDAEGQLKFKALLLIAHHKLSLLPLILVDDNGEPISLSEAKIALFDNNSPTALASPACIDGGTYDDGFPDDAGYQRYQYVKYKDASDVEQTYQTGEMVYLFNPLPIDVSSCSGTDADRDNKPRLRILIDGYTPTAAKLAESGKSFEELFVPGLPKLNQAMYSNYENVCVDGSNQYVSCSSSNVAQRYLKPPGKICFNNVETPGVDSCIGNANNALTTGFYFFANASDSPLHSFEYTQNDDDVDGDGNSDFRPAIQVECKTTPDKNLETVYDIDCDGTQSKVRIHTRYRRVFEGFLTFGLMTLPNTNLLPYFYNPNQVGVAEHVVIGSHGSEVGPLGRGGNPTIKHFMDFRGCYEVDVETNQVSACN